MQTVTVDIINNKAVRLLRDLELLRLIHIRKEENGMSAITFNWATKYKGAMTKQSPIDIDNQLKELRNEWE